LTAAIFTEDENDHVSVTRGELSKWKEEPAQQDVQLSFFLYLLLMRPRIADPISRKLAPPASTLQQFTILVFGPTSDLCPLISDL